MATIESDFVKDYVVKSPSTLESFLQHRLPGGKKKGNSWICGDITGEPGNSLSVPLSGELAGIYKDFNTGESGDIFSLVATQENLNLKTDFKKIVEIVSAEVGYSNFEVKRASTSHQHKPKPVANLADIVAQLTGKSYPAPVSHKYLASKGIEPHDGLLEILPGDYNRILKRSAKHPVLLVPMCDVKGNLQSYQAIEYQSELKNDKQHLPGAKVKGLICAIPTHPTQDDETLYLAEGYATAKSIYEVIGIPSICCFGKNNMREVAVALRQEYHSASIVLCADIDAIDYVKELAIELKCEYCIPGIVGKPTGDFNDLAQENKAIALECLNNRMGADATNPIEPADQAKVLDATNPSAETVQSSVLDTTLKYVRLDLLKHIDDSAVISRLSRSLHQATLIPESTIFMVGMGIFSSVATRAYVVDYAHKGSIPISLYVCAEQPSGAAKTRVMNTFTKPFTDVHKELREALQGHLVELKRRKKAATDKAAKEELDNEIDELEEKGNPLLFVSNSTAEALENSLHGTGGFFSCVSSEQGLFNSIFGLSYSGEKSKPNRDIILHGYDDGFYGGLRVSRNAYYGNVTGGIALFAQNGSIQTVLGTSDDTGLAERFLLLAEPHALGTRDHFSDGFVGKDTYDAYDSICNGIAEGVSYPIDKEKLKHLSISPKGWYLIKSYRNRIEPELADGKRFSHGALRGQAAKIDMTIMKIASNLHLLGGETGQEIDNAIVESAIGIANDLLESAVTIMDVKQISGKSAACQAIVETITNKGRPLTEREIMQSCYPKSVFKHYTGDKAEYIRNCIHELVQEQSIAVSEDKKKRLFSIA